MRILQKMLQVFLRPPPTAWWHFTLDLENPDQRPKTPLSRRLCMLKLTELQRPTADLPRTNTLIWKVLIRYICRTKPWWFSNMLAHRPHWTFLPSCKKTPSCNVNTMIFNFVMASASCLALIKATIVVNVGNLLFSDFVKKLF